MRTDRQELDHGRLVDAETVDWDHGTFRHTNKFSHTAVDVDAHDPNIHATVRFTLAASYTRAARNIGINRDNLT